MLAALSTSSISILIVEDDAPLRQEFERMVQAHDGLHLLGAAGTLAQARALLQSCRPDVMIVDLGLPDGDGVELIATVARERPETASLVATVFGDEAHVIRAIEAGARGYLLKDTSLEEFAHALRVVHDGGSPLSPRIACHLLKRLAPAAQPAWQAGPNALTGREIDILTRISQGYTVAEAASLMHISAHTASTHVKNIYSKLAVRNRVEAVNLARRQGLIR